jgi:hypothetical protein
MGSSMEWSATQSGSTEKAGRTRIHSMPGMKADGRRSILLTIMGIGQVLTIDLGRRHVECWRIRVRRAFDAEA